MVLAPGETLGGYRIRGVIGVGGMAIVYRAEQLSLGREVALKVLSAKLSHDEAFRERFRLEGKNVAALDHPNIVSVYDSGEVDGHLFLAMRLVQGSTLADRMHGHGLSAEETLRILGPIAAALDAAHAAGVVHRDVKPQNILLADSGDPYLADFGVAKGLHAAGMTTTDGFVGSFNYAAPEQFLGTPATAATNIYALTVVVFQCLTGELPYARNTDAGALVAYVNEAPATNLTALRPVSALNEIVARGMANDPARRYERATSLLAAATAVINGLTDSQRRTVPPFTVSASPDLEIAAALAHRAGLARALQSSVPGAIPSRAVFDETLNKPWDGAHAGAVPAPGADDRSAPPREPAPGRRRSTVLAAIGIGILAIAVISLVAMLASAVVRRWRRNPRRGAAVRSGSFIARRGARQRSVPPGPSPCVPRSICRSGPLRAPCRSSAATSSTRRPFPEIRRSRCWQVTDCRRTRRTCASRANRASIQLDAERWAPARRVHPPDDR